MAFSFCCTALSARLGVVQQGDELALAGVFAWGHYQWLRTSLINSLFFLLE
jgi:hypothetical protein